MRKIWDIPGGVHPPENKIQSTTSDIADLPLPAELVIPLNQHIGNPAVPMVRVGQRVLKGQVIGEAEGVFSAHVHASSSGTVTAIEKRPIAHPSGLSTQCVVIATDGLDQWCALTPCADYTALDHFELVQRIQQAGLAGMGGAGFPTSVKLNPKSVDRVETLILNGTECEPYITADDRLMREEAAGIIEGAKLLAKIVGHPKTILIGIEDNKPEAIAAMQQAASGSGVEVVAFPTKYPSGGEKQLIQILTGIELPSGKLPAQIGVLVHNVGTAYAAWRAVRFGEPLIERVTTVVGKALRVERNVRALIGTPVAHLLALHGFQAEAAARVVIGGPMMGFAITDLNAPVVKTTNCVLAPSHHEMPPAPPAQACIRCGLCAEACPAQLLPQQLYWYAKADDTERLKDHHLFDCIECGACSYVCPSAIPLVQYYRAAKGSIRLQEAEKLKADRARVRFDQRKERIARAEAEKEAKRLARKQAAEAAKKQLAEAGAQQAAEVAPEAAPQATVAAARPTPAKTDLVAEAIARAKSQSSNPAALRKKLERALDSAQSRLARAQEQYAACDDPAQQEKLGATVKQAELKLADAEAKLAAEEASAPPVTNPMAKLTASPVAAQEKAVAMLTTRLSTARAKLSEAAGSPNEAALAQGVAKLEAKLVEAQAELARLQQTPAATEATAQPAAVLDAAAAAIARAKARAQEAAELSPSAKRAAEREALHARLTKAQQRLAAAEAEQSEHVAALRASLAKLEAKWQEISR